ncbi:hypothetical protein EMPG_13249 [Blastomyces silverae]|uniref:Uncharacterized protein n=1 Tax=Blastomyces silverae TaxID=2060906 RepID=A0A0H1BJQ0_9EURO|nr:hypothetical protein EMPG_13249 [Blastomyces silverae]
MKWAFLAVAALLAQPGISRISPYDRLDSERPDNVTGLDFFYYSDVGSYYNGTFTLRISPLYDPPNYSFEDTDYPCQEFENRTFEISMNAIAGFQEISPKSYPQPNPFYLSIEAWDMHYNLTPGTGPTQRKSANYSEYQEIHAYTGMATGTHGPIWIYNMTNTPNNNNNNKDDDEPLYRFAGNMNAIDFLQTQVFKFNASGICSGGSDIDDLLYDGSLLSPTRNGHDDWAGDPIPTPRISGSFNTRVAQVTMSGLFMVGNGNRGSMVGRAEMIFRGEIDEERSDQLLLGKSVPEWNATLGFVRGSVGGAKSGATRVWGLGEVGGLVFGGVVMGFGIAVPLVFF